MYSLKIDKSTGVLCDQIGKLKGFYVSKEYPVKLRRVKFYDKETKRTFVFLTNHFQVTSDQVALLYKNRWQIELFFKWIKQHLKIKSFWGTSENAVRIQIYSANYVLLGSYRWKRAENRALNLRNITGNWYIPTGQNACK